MPEGLRRPAPDPPPELAAPAELPAAEVPSTKGSPRRDAGSPRTSVPRRKRAAPAYRSRKVTAAIVLAIAEPLAVTQAPWPRPRGLISFEAGADGWKPLFDSIR
jgi:hypothetical protein